MGFDAQRRDGRATVSGEPLQVTGVQRTLGRFAAYGDDPRSQDNESIAIVLFFHLA